MRKRLLPLIGTLTLACTAVASVSYATDPQPGDTAIQEVEKGDLNTSTDAAATTPLRDTRFYYAHACAENRTGWSFYGDKIAWAAGHWNVRSEEHTSELQSLRHLVCRLLLEKKNKKKKAILPKTLI